MLSPCLGGICYFYMDSRDGHIYPCGYRGEEDLGASVAGLGTRSGAQQPFCKKCHWECFMDPSQLFGILRHVIRRPLKALAGKAADPQLLRLWLGDLKYYLDCDLFDGRKPPRKRR
jgi:hypothetical protein